MRDPVRALAVLALAAACGGKVSGVNRGDGGSSGLSSSGGASSCYADITIDCSGGGDGFACTAGNSPEAEDPSLTCSASTPDGNGDVDYCCFAASGGGPLCEADDNLTGVCLDPDSYGFQCDIGGDPAADDSSLTCSAGTMDPDGVHDDYCCRYTPGGSSSGSSSGGQPPPGCAADTTIPCSGGADGYACAAGDNPEAEDTSLSCSVPIASADGEDDFCCFSGGSWSSTTCVPNDELTSVCTDPTSYGYQCDAGHDPTSYDSQLSCRTPTPDPDGVHDDFCCTYE